MASVYRAIDERLDRAVAVKVLAPPYADDPAFAERFLAEARTAAAFSHPNLAHVYDSGSDDGVHFMVLELLDRHRSLRDELGRRGHLPPGEAGSIALDVLAALEPFHAHGMVHCDIKPGNVMIGPEGTKLVDFGIARSLRSAAEGATSVGSLHAMSPEQLRGRPVGPSSDLFAVGVLLHTMLTGLVPFDGDTPEEVIAAQRAGSPPPSRLIPELDPRMDGVVLQALRLDPAHRFESASAMSTALRTVLEPRREAGTGPIDDETTQLHPVANGPSEAAVSEPGPMTAASPPPTGRRPNALGVSAVVVALAVPVVMAGVLLLGSPDADARATPDPTARDTAGQTPTLAPGTVRVPDTIGMSEAEAQAAAQEAGLEWRIEWRVVPGRTPGVYDQEPAPGSMVRRGSPFVMLAYRTR
jgi:serine/threonine-protein kinase